MILNNLRAIPDYQHLLPAPITDISDDKRYVNENKVNDHYAILITEESVDLSTLSKEELIIYDLIARSMIAAHYPDATIHKTEIVTVVDGLFTRNRSTVQYIQASLR